MQVDAQRSQPWHGRPTLQARPSCTSLARPGGARAHLEAGHGAAQQRQRLQRKGAAARLGHGARVVDRHHHLPVGRQGRPPCMGWLGGCWAAGRRRARQGSPSGTPLAGDLYWGSPTTHLVAPLVGARATHPDLVLAEVACNVADDLSGAGVQWCRRGGWVTEGRAMKRLGGCARRTCSAWSGCALLATQQHPPPAHPRICPPTFFMLMRLPER